MGTSPRPTLGDAWPSLPLAEWKDTYATLHMWTQIVGKIRKTLAPHVNHWWNVALYVDARGLTTSAIPYERDLFEIRFDFLDHKLKFETSRDAERSIDLAPRAVADFYREVMATLRSLGIEVNIHATPDEVAEPIPFAEDRRHHSYDPACANRFWRILASSSIVFNEFRARFIGKCSPVNFYWGSFDLAVTRFSGRRAPERPGADAITREAYSHEVISAGFWPGGGDVTGPAFYSYAAPEPPGYGTQKVRPDTAFYDEKLKGFVLMYEDVRRADSPEATLMDFLQTTYETGATLGNWDRAALERTGV